MKIWTGREDLFENDLFNITLLISIVLYILGGFGAYMVGLSINIVYVDIVSIIINSIFLYFSVKNRRHDAFAIPFFIMTSITLIITWYFNGGSEGSVNYALFLMAVMMNVIFYKNSTRGIRLFTLLVVVMAGLHIYEIYHPEILNQFLAHKKQEELVSDRLFGFIMTTVVSFAYMLKLNKQVQREKQQVQAQNEELQVQQEELMAQQEVMEEQQRELEKTNKDLLKSINYASKIQNALSRNSLQELKKKSNFLINKPRDIVSGDFYWVRKVENKTFFVQGDCTGHGVPGAFLTLLGEELLDQIILSDRIWSPARILEELDIRIKEKIAGDSNSNTDGMEVGLLMLDHKINVGVFAGAKRPLLFYNSKTEEMSIIKGSRKSIGNVRNVDNEFHEEVFKVNEKDRFYLFSDGFADQFGEILDKKYSSRRFYSKMEELSALEISKQGEELEREFAEWKGRKRQIDDVMVMGVEV
ncbi:SpoIIE family protein phosphatase [Limibacter armeniacum]|uniref:PP2C family protein-serine/threonine phosphatase n=1 Tax=Limibacter armeniacum TaxID=466084 RepID=UPI002FE696BA